METTRPTSLRGEPLAREVARATRARLARLDSAPALVALVASDDPATRVYLERKAGQAGKLGITFRTLDLGAGVGQERLEAELRALSQDPAVGGVMLELPLAPHLDAEGALAALPTHKDVEGLSPANLALIAAGREPEAMLPPTPSACRMLLEQVIDLRGAHVAVVGPGRTVGRPLVWLLNNAGATVTVCNPFTQKLAEVLAPCDAVVVAVGRPCLLEGRHVRPHQVVIDAGINVSAGLVVGDVAADVADVARALTPVPGGVGPLTSALLLANFARLLERRG